MEYCGQSISFVWLSWQLHRETLREADFRPAFRLSSICSTGFSWKLAVTYRLPGIDCQKCLKVSNASLPKRTFSRMLPAFTLFRYSEFDMDGVRTGSAVAQAIFGSCLEALRLKLLRNERSKASLLYPCFKTALCYGVVSGCFVHGVSPSSRFRPELAPKRGLEGPELAFRTPENARKVHAKSSGP